jgi:hypothetical protein
MDRPSRLDQLRYYRARVASGALTLDEAARALSAETDGGLTEYGARDLLSQPVADVEAAYTQLIGQTKRDLAKWQERAAQDDAR